MLSAPTRNRRSQTSRAPSCSAFAYPTCDKSNSLAVSGRKNGSAASKETPKPNLSTCFSGKPFSARGGLSSVLLARLPILPFSNLLEFWVRSGLKLCQALGLKRISRSPKGRSKVGNELTVSCAQITKRWRIIPRARIACMLGPSTPPNLYGSSKGRS